MLLQLTGEFEKSFTVNWSFDPADEINIRRFKIRWCHDPSCRLLVRRRRFIRQAEVTEWVERDRAAHRRRSFTLTVTDTVYALQIIAEAISDEVPVPSLTVSSDGKP